MELPRAQHRFRLMAFASGSAAESIDEHDES